MLSLRLELIEEIAESTKHQLESDALRTIRQRNPEKGMEYLYQIEGIQRFVEALRQACNSAYYRQLRMVQEEREQQPARAKVQAIRKKGAKS